jgi:hypothetical protein
MTAPLLLKRQRRSFFVAGFGDTFSRRDVAGFMSRKSVVNEGFNSVQLGRISFEFDFRDSPDKNS